MPVLYSMALNQEDLLKVLVLATATIISIKSHLIKIIRRIYKAELIKENI
jgi:hypothetical protein